MHEGVQKFLFIPASSCGPGDVEVTDVQFVHTFDVGIHLASVVVGEGGDCFDIDVAFSVVDWDLS